MKRPESTEFEAAYLSHYIGLVEGDDVIKRMELQQADVLGILGGISEEQGNSSYAPGKWSLKEVIGHMLDAERVFSYRLMCIARGEKNSLPGFDENEYAANSEYNKRSLEEIATEYKAVRQASISLIKHLSEEALSRIGLANGKFITPRAIAFATAGHEAHHVQVIKDRYLQY